MGPSRSGGLTVRTPARGARAPHEDYRDRTKGRPAVARLHQPFDAHERIDSPLILQYTQLCARYPEALLFMRVGDFYEAYGDAAVDLAKSVNIVLTSKEAGKGRRVAMAGVPHHNVDHYVARLLRQRRVVAIAEQMEPPAPNRLVRREVVRVLTPGTLLEDHLLTAERNNYLCAIATEAGKTAIAAADISTASASVSVVGNDDELAAELDRLAPAEVVVEVDSDVARYQTLVDERCRIAVFDSNHSVENVAAGLVPADAAGLAPAVGLAVDEQPAARAALTLMAEYLRHLGLDGHTIAGAAGTHDPRSVMMLDPATRRHLDLLAGSGSNARASLLGVLARTKTPMGSRLLAQRLCAPSLDVDEIRRRQNHVTFFFERTGLRVDLQHGLSGVGDIERIVQKVRARRAGPRDVAALRDSLQAATRLRDSLMQSDDSAFAESVVHMNAGINSRDYMSEALVDDPPPTLADGGVIRPEYSTELREAVELRTKTRDLLLALEERTKAATGIKSLKIKYTQAFGYYYEVTRANVDSVPAQFVRRQSLVNAERFTDEELRRLEADILSGRARQIAIERELFEQLAKRIDADAEALLGAARSIAEVDLYCGLAQVAGERRYVRPMVVAENVMHVEQGRHPVLEVFGGADFVANDCHIDADRRFLILTGPNMGGKSTYLRQAALLSIMAQMGSFVPAERATIGIIDRLFTRIGAGDDIASGRSTFYVEMAEMALILRRCTARSLLLIDEVGRGTGTTDGYAIAQALGEHLLQLDDAMPMVLFATHFHDLVRLADEFEPVENLQVAVAETRAGPIFSHRILPGSSSRSYGIAVARTAGLPEEVVQRAREIADNMERRPAVAPSRKERRRTASFAGAAQEDLQLNLGT